jgi:hypothetical protein
MIYEPVYRMENFSFEDGWMRGWAYPQTGSRCCALGLYNDAALIFALRCDRFSQEAADRGIRDGWCAFELRVGPELFVQSDRATIRCLRSGVELGAVERGSQWPASHSARKLEHGTVEKLMAGDEHGIFAIEPYLPVIERLAIHLSDENLGAFLFRFLLRRTPDEEGLAIYTRQLRAGVPCMNIMDELMNSDEYKKLKNVPFPNVFSEDFRELPIFLPAT